MSVNIRLSGFLGIGHSAIKTNELALNPLQSSVMRSHMVHAAHSTHAAAAAGPQISARSVPASYGMALASRWQVVMGTAALGTTDTVHRVRADADGDELQSQCSKGGAIRALLALRTSGHYSLVLIIAARRYSLRLPPATFSNQSAEMPSSTAAPMHSATVSSSCSSARSSA